MTGCTFSLLFIPAAKEVTAFCCSAPSPVAPAVAAAVALPSGCRTSQSADVSSPSLPGSQVPRSTAWLSCIRPSFPKPFPLLNTRLMHPRLTSSSLISGR
eukprot:GHVT01060237.1.p2 GENE.GHVT01060237.1~~GHVT01060237.1.p2  ORF type:complete len:100 (+),score=16.26 GHVT01060237.1:2109-2408(+)